MNAKVLSVGILVFLVGVFVGTAQTYVTLVHNPFQKPAVKKIVKPTPVITVEPSPTPQVIYRYIYINKAPAVPVPTP